MTLEIGILGSGQQAIRAAGAIRSVPSLHLAGIWSRDPGRAARAAEAAGTEVLQGPADGRIQAVFVAAESHRHADLGIEAARAGKHVLVEKPIDVSLEKAEALVAECRGLNVLLSVVAQKRFTPRFARVKAVLDQGLLGRALSATVLLRIHRPAEYFRDGNGWRGDAARGGGVLLNQGIHHADLLCWWLGECVGGRGFGTTSTAAGSVRFASGAVASLVLSTDARPGLAEFFEIVGEKGAIQLEGGRVRIWDVPGQKPSGLLGPLTGKLPLPLRTALTKEALSAPKDGRIEDQLENFASAVGGKAPLASTGEEGLRALALIRMLTPTS